MKAMFTSLMVVLGAVLAAGPVAGQKTDPPTAPKPPTSVAGRPIADWIKDLKHIDPSVRENAVRTLPIFGEDARDGVPDIIDLVNRDLDVSLRVNGCLVLGQISVRDRDKPAAVAGLAKRATDDTQAIVRFHAALALGHFEVHGKDAIPALVTAAKDRASWEIRKAALTSLAKVGAAKAPASPDLRATQALLDGLKDPSAKVRLEATVGLGAIGTHAIAMHKQAVVRALHAMLSDRDKTIVVWSLVGLIAHDPAQAEQCLTAITKLLKTGDVPTRGHAARALGIMAKESKTRVPDLIDAIKDAEPSVGSMACWAIGEIGTWSDPGTQAVAALKEAVEGKSVDESVKEEAALALEKIKGKKPAKP